MDLGRPEKQTVRQLWVAETTMASGRGAGDDEPLYLTLSGAHGRDIDELISAGVISRADNEAIADGDQFKVIAVESSPLAVLALQKKFPGLKILEQPFQSIIRGRSPYKWPNKDEERYCRALVINLDLNQPLGAAIDDGNVVFPVIAWVGKLAQLHADAPRRDWSLCLTLHGEIAWNEEVCSFVQQFLADNFAREGRFATACAEFLGQDVYDSINEVPVRFPQFSRELQQAILMVFVPKYILRTVQHLGWRVTTEYNLRYGPPGVAPMVTWICRFRWSVTAINAPDAVYREGLVDILRAAGLIDAHGSIQRLPRDG